MKNLKLNIWVISVIIAFLGFLGPNPIEFGTAILTVPFLIQMFYRAGEPPVLLMGFLLQWLSTSLKVIYGWVINVPFYEIMPSDSNSEFMYPAFYLSIVGLLVFGFGTFLVVNKIPQKYFIEKWEKSINSYDLRKIVLFYIIFFLIDSYLLQYLFLIPGLTSFIIVFDKLKWGFFLVAFYLVHRKNRYKTLFYILMVIQFIISIGFFSGFKEVIYFSIIGLLTINKRLRFQQIALLVIVFVFLIRLGVIWTSIKVEYRSFLTGGEKGQATVVSQGEAIGKFFDLALSADPSRNQEAFDNLVDRISYIDYFSLTLGYVPEVVPHENGKIWKEAIAHVLVPRFLNPNKRIIDDSEHTTKYTGRTFQGEGLASFSLGYTADSYIDFGYFFMFIPIFFLGLAIGFFYKFILTKSYNIFWGTVFIAPFLYFTNVYGTDTIKILGWFFSYVILILVIRKYLAFLINRYLINYNRFKIRTIA